MLRCALISSDQKLTRELETALAKVPDLHVAKVFTKCPSAADLLQAIRVRKINLLVFFVDDLLGSAFLAKAVDDLMPGFPIITAGNHDDMQALQRAMHLGVREHITSPIQETKLREAIDGVRQRLESRPVNNVKQAELFAFLPARPGVGATTIALSTSCALAEMETKTLLLDCDIAAGTIQFLLKMNHTASFVEALQRNRSIDEDLWSQMVGKWEKLYVLHAGELGLFSYPDPAAVQPLLAIARAQYEVICADLPSSLDPLTVTVLQESNRIMLVTTPELVSLHMAASRVRCLNGLGLLDRVSLLLNRKTKAGVKDSEVATIVGLPISFGFSNDYRAVQGSILKGSPLPDDSELGKSVLELAHSLAKHATLKPSPHSRKFLEFFRLPPDPTPDVVWRG